MGSHEGKNHGKTPFHVAVKVCVFAINGRRELNGQRIQLYENAPDEKIVKL